MGQIGYLLIAFILFAVINGLARAKRAQDRTARGEGGDWGHTATPNEIRDFLRSVTKAPGEEERRAEGIIASAHPGAARPRPPRPPGIPEGRIIPAAQVRRAEPSVWPPPEATGREPESAGGTTTRRIVTDAAQAPGRRPGGGRIAAAPPQAQVAPVAAAALEERFSLPPFDTRGLRQAFVMSEVLSPPVSLRDPKSPALRIF